MTFNDLESGEQNLFRLMRAISFGRLENITINNGHAEVTAASRKIVTANFDHDDLPYEPSRSDGNFLLTDKHIRFLQRVRKATKGKIKSITITSGLPARAEIEEAIISI